MNSNISREARKNGNQLQQIPVQKLQIGLGNSYEQWPCAQNHALKRLNSMEIRYTQASDIADLKDILDQTNLFPSAKLEGMLTSFLDGDTEDLWLTCENGGKAIGFCHAAPNEMVDGAWCMPAIAILPKYHGSGACRAKRACHASRHVCRREFFRRTSVF